MLRVSSKVVELDSPVAVADVDAGNYRQIIKVNDMAASPQLPYLYAFRLIMVSWVVTPMASSCIPQKLLISTV